MSVVMDSNTDRMPVYVALLGEGTGVWRPVKAVCLGSDHFILIRPSDYDCDDEKWEFLPGTIVRCERRVMGGEFCLVAVGRVDS